MNDEPDDRVQEARREEFEQELLEHLDALYRAALRLTQNVRDAEDLVQDSSLKAYRFRHRFQRGSNFKAWIFKILNNLWINGFHRSAKEPRLVTLNHVADIRRLHEDNSAPSDPEEALFTRLLDDEVKAALDNLPPHFRAIVILRDVEGFSYREIADIVGCAVGTVRSRLARGRKMLRSKLLEYARRRGYLGNQAMKRLVRDGITPETAPARLKDGLRRKLAAMRKESGKNSP